MQEQELLHAAHRLKTGLHGDLQLYSGRHRWKTLLNHGHFRARQGICLGRMDDPFFGHFSAGIGACCLQYYFLLSDCRCLGGDSVTRARISLILLSQKALRLVFCPRE